MIATCDVFPRLATITRLQSNGEEMPHHPQDPPHSRLARTRQGSLLNLFQVGVLNVILAWTTSGFAGPLEDAVAAWRQRDVAKAFELLRPLAEQGVAQAQWRLGMIYLTEQKNDAEAVKWFRKAADQDDDQGQWFLGNMYFSGWGVRKDEVEAASWYRKAADKGHIDAQRTLGIIYITGQGVVPDHVEAAKWMRKAADQGDSTAQESLGLMYHRGDGVPQDYVLAHMWSILAVAQGAKGAAFVRDAAAEKMTPEQIGEAQRLAREWKPVVGKQN